MSQTTKIEWTDATWNPVHGCSKVSAGCTNCYAERLSHRFGWTKQPWNTTYADENVQLHPERLNTPHGLKKARRVFVNSTSDLFHERVPFEYIRQVFSVMYTTKQHTYQVLTKRPERLLSFMKWYQKELHDDYTEAVLLPFPNVWLGVSLENQDAANERVPLLLQAPAAVRFLSCEPLLGPLDLEFTVDAEHPNNEGYGIHAMEGIDWVIVGAESGPSARFMNEDWVASIRDQSLENEIPFFYKQKRVGRRVVHEPELEGRTWTEFPKTKV